MEMPMSLDEVVGIYLPNIVAVLLSSVVLSIMGSHLASRSESLQAFLASQSASLGITLGLAVVIFLGKGIEVSSSIPIVSAFSCAVIFFVIGQKLISLHRTKSSEILISLFLFSLAMNFLLTAAFPRLESHFSSSFMGDIATASSVSSWWLAKLSILIGTFVLSSFKRIVFQSFWKFSSGVDFNPKLNLVFYIFCAFFIVECTRIFGFLYTSSSLVVVPLAASLVARGLFSFWIQAVVISILSSGLGFFLSLYSSNFSTSASIVVFQFVLSSVWIVCMGIYRKLRKDKLL